MLPGPTLVKQCDACQGYYLQRTISSGNTGGAKYWTDGKMAASMLPRTPILIKCPHCEAILWSKEPKQVDSFETYLLRYVLEKDEKVKEAGIAEAEEKRARYERTPYYAMPTFQDLNRYVQSGDAASRDELKIRFHAWLTGNDARRYSDNPSELLPDEVANVERIVALLGPNHVGYSALVLAEAYRELGKLAEARSVIDNADLEPREEYSAQFILELIDAGDTQVCEVVKEDEREWQLKRRRNRRLAAQFPQTIEFSQDGPPLFEVKSRDWWFKVLSMGCHNWALIEEIGSGVSVLFFHDLGGIQGNVPGYKTAHLRGRCAIVDSLDFDTVDQARLELELNGFGRLEERPGPWDGMEPFGNFFDARSSEKGVYSSGDLWVTEQSVIERFERTGAFE